MKKLLLGWILLCPALAFSQSASPQRAQLPNGWSLTPAGSSLPLGDLTLNIAVAGNKKYLAVTNNGQSVQSIQLIDIASESGSNYVAQNITVSLLPAQWLSFTVQPQGAQALLQWRSA